MANVDDKVLLPITKSLDGFTNNFHKNLANAFEENLVSSPLSAHVVLSMVTCGAEDSTHEELRQALQLPEDQSVLQEGYKAFIEYINNLPKVTLKVANKIYVNHLGNIEKDFQKLTKDCFHSESEPMNFGLSDESAGKINKWCEEQTDGKIKNLVAAADFSDNTGVVLLSAIYLKAQWKNLFKVKDTEDRRFYLNKNEHIYVPTMTTKQEFFYKPMPELNAKVIGLQYTNEDLMMVIIVPNDIDGLKDVEANLEKFDIDYAGEFRRKECEVKLFLPKFKIETTIDMQPHLEKMGVKLAFTEDANFEKISDVLGLLIDKVVQKAFIAIDEFGTEAGAASCVVMSWREVPPTLKVDRPFVYQIVDMKRRFVLFSGHVVNPLKV
ncbi:hypothetical protein TKK_0006115 [Trichogramma kaykai]|uniref:Serpin domain-containing protein n=1 Tax=Trichogramma kaykai TaxID=54128 RepID=A0ABD2XFH2_9HYME